MFRVVVLCDNDKCAWHWAGMTDRMQHALEDHFDETGHNNYLVTVT